MYQEHLNSLLSVTEAIRVRKSVHSDSDLQSFLLAIRKQYLLKLSLTAHSPVMDRILSPLLSHFTEKASVQSLE